ncbi:MAG: hypothetical protein B7Z20_06300 [Sphingobium sp. 32-64-5]|nr:MAG: hypothetical protein B7Z20_06300 [Sphingobium sp. 32-64-5]
MNWRAFRSSLAAQGLMVAGALALASCAHKAPPPIVEAPRPVPPPVVPTQPDLEAVWHVRAGLNVGALSCRGQYDVLADQYNRLLEQHEELLGQAYRFEEGRFAGAELDRHLTQIYNRFANQRSPQEFCGTVQSVLERGLAADATSFSISARDWLTQLEAALL